MERPLRVGRPGDPASDLGRGTQALRTVPQPVRSQEAAMSLKPGTTIGDYRVVKKLGEGGMGEVYLAVHETLGQKVVLKGLHEQFWRNRELGDRLEREAAAMARLSHPNIVTIYNFLHTSEGA